MKEIFTNNQTSSVEKSRHNNVIPMPHTTDQRMGTVYLVGAGPGDPELLTVKAMRVLAEADVVVYDRLVHPDIVALANPQADTFYVGKQKDFHSVPQHEICELLVTLARCGKNVVRLKGGDPFVFGRGGEEIDRLEAAGVDWHVIPGITAASGFASTSGIPLTHRDHAHAVTLITGHRENGKLDINWELVLQEDQTVVFYMGLSNLADICSGLIARGKPETTPIAVMANATTDSEQMLVGTLNTLPRSAVEAGIPSPALIVMGDVIRSRQYLAGLAQLSQVDQTAAPSHAKKR